MNARGNEFWLGLGLIALAGFVGCAVPPPGDGTSNTNANANDNSAARCATGTTGGSATVSYVTDFRGLLTTAGCLATACHSGAVVSNNFRLDTYESSFEPGSTAEALDLCPIVPGDADNSFLFQKITCSDTCIGLPMPNNGTTLTDDQIALVRTWIEEGAQNN